MERQTGIEVASLDMRQIFALLPMTSRDRSLACMQACTSARGNACQSSRRVQPFLSLYSFRCFCLRSLTDTLQSGVQLLELIDRRSPALTSRCIREDHGRFHSRLHSHSVSVMRGVQARAREPESESKRERRNERQNKSRRERISCHSLSPSQTQCNWIQSTSRRSLASLSPSLIPLSQRARVRA